MEQQTWDQLSPYQQFQLLQQQQQQSLLQAPPDTYYNDLTAEDTEWFTEPGGPDAADAEYQRLAETALDSWRLHQNEKEMKKISSRLSLSGRGFGETTELKGFIDPKRLTGLYKAAFRGDANGIMSIVKRDGRNAPLNELDENGCTPLMYAALSDSDSAIEMLLNFSARREGVDRVGRTAVHYAAFYGKSKALKFLIESGSDWTPRDLYGRTPLHWASVAKNTKCLLVLLNYASIVNGNINPQDNEGMTPVHCAAQFGSAKHLTLMIEANCDFSFVDIERKTALHWIVDNKDTTCLHAIVNHSPYLLNKQDINGQTLLHISSKKGIAGLVEQLLNIDGIEIDTRDKQDRTPLHFASMEGHSNVVQLLVNFHALDSCIDTFGLTALHYAVHVNSVSCVKLLVQNEHATHIPSADDQGFIPLSLAALSGLNDIVKALLVNPHIANEINRCDSNKLSALHYACQGGFYDTVVTLLKHGSDPNQLDNANMSPLDIVCEKGFYLCIGPLINEGADDERIGDDGFSIIHRAILSENLEILKALINAGCNVEVRDSNGRLPLELSVYTGNKEITALLLQLSNADPNTMDVFGLTMLHIAAKEGKNEILQLLLVNNGYVNNMDATENRYTPLDYAIQNNHFECIKTLESKGALQVHEIKTIAATWIQSTYRKYRAIKLLKKLQRERMAAICIQRIARGFIHRRQFQRLQKKLKSSIMIQAVVRGFLARRLYKKMLQKHNEERKRHQLIENFGRMLINLQTMEPIVINTEGLDLKKKEQDEKKKEHQIRIEQSMRMRERYMKEQQKWEEFRLAERQRRKEKAHQEEQARLMIIIENSRQRRKYFEQKFKYTMTIQSYHQAAIVIQRAYRKTRMRRERERKEVEFQKQKQQLLEMWAARVIQRAWRCYIEWKRFEADHLDSIITSPVVIMPSGHLPIIQHKRLYERSTIVSGTRRHKLHKTHQSGFKVFKVLPSTSQSYTRPNNKAKLPPVLDSDKALSPRMKSMTYNWPWSKEIIMNTPDEAIEALRLPNVMVRPSGHHGNSSFGVATPLKLPRLKMN